MDVHEVFTKFETRLVELMRPQFRDEFLRRFRRYHQPLASMLQDLPVRAAAHSSRAKLARAVAHSEHFVYLMGEFAAFLIGRLDDFVDGIDVSVQNIDEDVLLDCEAHETCQYDGISVRFAFETLPRQEHTLGFHCAIALPLLFPKGADVSRILIDECECWWRNAVCVREYDECRKSVYAREGDQRRFQRSEGPQVRAFDSCREWRMLQNERWFQRLNEVPESQVRSFLRAMLGRGLPVFVNWNTALQYQPPTLLRYLPEMRDREPQTLMRHLLESDGGATVHRMRERCRRYTVMNFLEPYCECCRARQRLAVARIKWWRFEACESLDRRWFRSAVERYSAEPRMQRVQQPAAVERRLRNIQLLLLARRAFLLWNMRAALAAYRRCERPRVRMGHS